MPNPHLLIRLFITREAVLSGKIEGTQATIGEILAASAGISVQRNPDDLQEVQNYIAPILQRTELQKSLILLIVQLKEVYKSLKKQKLLNRLTVVNETEFIVLKIYWQFLKKLQKLPEILNDSFKARIIIPFVKTELLYL